MLLLKMEEPGLHAGAVTAQLPSMDSNVPPLSCGRIRVTSGSHGRGRNFASFPRLGPSLS